MAQPTSDIGFGTILAFGTAGYWGIAGAGVLTVNIDSISWSSIARESIDSSHMNQAAAATSSYGNMTFVGGDLTDPGEFTVEFHHNPDIEPPIDRAPTVFTITYRDAADLAGSIHTGNGFFTSFDFNIPKNELMTGSATFKVTGPVAVTIDAG